MYKNKTPILNVIVVNKDGLPLEDAVIGLYEEACIYEKKKTCNHGRVEFEIFKGTHFILKEIAAPHGYKKVTTTYFIECDCCGNICVNGESVDHLVIKNYKYIRCAKPIVEDIYLSDETIRGTGVAGCTIQVILPDQTMLETTVDEERNWVAEGLSGHILGDVIKITQRCETCDTSEIVEKTVITIE